MSDSEYDSDGSSCTGATEATEATDVSFSSFQEALEEMMAGLAQLDEGLNSINTTTQILEQPIATVAIQGFTNPRVLEAAPFRATKFRLRPEAKVFLKTPHHAVTRPHRGRLNHDPATLDVVTFVELCAAIRQAIRERKEEVITMWGTSDFLGILQKLPEIVE